MSNNTFDSINMAINIPVNVEAQRFISPTSRILNANVADPIENKVKKYLSVAEPISDYYNSIHDGICANPSKKDVIDSLNATYVEHADVEVERNNIINSPDGMKSFCNLLSFNGTVRTIFIKAPRGTGKTTLLNYFLNNYTRYLEINKKLFWYRVDVTKIYDEWKCLGDSRIDKRISLMDYLAIQVPFVTIKYEESSPGFKEILDKLSKDKIFFKLISKRNVFKNNFTKYIVRETLEDEHKNIDYTGYYKIMNMMTSFGYKVCIIIDGIDNIDFRLNKADYEEFLKQFISLFQAGKKETFISKYIVTLRRETYSHLRKRKPIFFVRTSYECFDMYPVSVTEMLVKKALVAKSPRGIFENYKNEDEVNRAIEDEKEKEKLFITLSTFAKFDDNFVEYSKKYVERLIYAFKDVLPDSPINNYKDIMDYIANDNLRDFVKNFINSYRMWLLFERKSRFVTDTARILEALVLNGRRYVYSQSSNSDQPLGYLIPNLFWFKVDDCEGKWHGLCTFRILQYLNSPMNPERSKLISLLETEFKYEREIIDERIYTLLKYGLITFGDDFETKKIEYELTKKGRFIPKLFFSSIDIFYQFALDTPLIACSSLYDNSAYNEFDSKEVSFHYGTADNLWNDYLSSSVKTSITLIRHLKTFHQIEMASVAERVQKYFRFSNDKYKILLDGIESNLDSLRAKNQEAYKTLLLDLNGITRLDSHDN